MSLFTLLLVVIGLVVVIGVLRGMNREDRSAVLKASITGAKAATVYVASQSKSVVRTSYDAGLGLGAQVSAEYHEQTNDLAKWSDDLEARGVTRVTAEVAKEHRKMVGLDEAANAAADYRKAQEAKLASVKL